MAAVDADAEARFRLSAGGLLVRLHGPVEPRASSLTGSMIGSRITVARPTAATRFYAPMIPMARSGAATVGELRPASGFV